MLVKLTLASSRHPIAFRAGEVRQVQKDDENPLITAVWTGMMQVVNGVQQPAMFAVLESVEEVVNKVNAAWDRMRNVQEPMLPGEKKIQHG